MPDTIERFLEVEESFFTNSLKLNICSAVANPLLSETCLFLFQDLFCLVYQPVENHSWHNLA